MANTELYDEHRYLEKGGQYLDTFLYKVNCVLGTIGLKAEMGEHLPLHIVIKDIKTNKDIVEWNANTDLINLGVTSPGGVFQLIKFNTLDGKEYELVTTNRGRFELFTREEKTNKNLAVVFDNDEVTGIDINAQDDTAGWDDMVERVVILNRPNIDKIHIQYYKDGSERSIYYKHEGEKEPYVLKIVEGKIDRSTIGERDVSGLIIKVLDDEHSIVYSNDERYGNVIPIATEQATSFIKQGFSLPRNQELFTHMRESLGEQYPGAMSLITSKLGDVVKLLTLNEPLEDEFVKMYEGFTSPIVEFNTSINMDEPYIIEEEPKGIIR